MMLASEIRTVSQTVSLSGVGQALASPIEQDPVTGLYMRTLRFKQLLDNGSVGESFHTLIISSPNRSGVELKTPELNY